MFDGISSRLATQSEGTLLEALQTRASLANPGDRAAGSGALAHMPLWTIFEPWRWGTSDADQLRRRISRLPHDVPFPA